MTDHIGDTNEMVPGPDLDRLVAGKVMGWVAVHRYGTSQIAYNNGRYVSASIITGNGERIDFAPSRNIAHAWEVVEQMADGFRNHQFENQSWWNFTNNELPVIISERPQDLPLEVCRAALRTMEPVPTLEEIRAAFSQMDWVADDDEDQAACPSCKRAWTDHPGIAPTCKQLSEANDLIADLFNQLAIDYEGGWMGDGALSICEYAADYLIAIGRLEQHPTRQWYRWTTSTTTTEKS
jgi:hypothetical protein